MPRASASPRPVRTPRPTVEPELVGPVKLPGPMPTPEPTIEPDYMTGDLTRDDILSKDTISIPTAVGIIGLMALGGLVIAFMANRIPKVIEKKRTRKKQSDIYRAKIHRRTEIHGAYKAREKYKERRKYRGSYRK